MTAGAQGAAPRERRRRSRLRRWLVRPLVWALTLILAAATGLYFFAHGEYVRGRVRGLLVSRLSAYLGRPVEIASVDYQLLRPSVTVRGLVVPSPAGFDRPFARARRVTVELGLRGSLSRIRVNVRRVEVVEPVVDVVFAADGATNLPEFGADRTAEEEGSGRVEVRFGSLLVQRGLVRVDDREIPLDLQAEAVWGRLTGPPGPVNAPGRNPTFTFQAVAQSVTTTLPGAHPFRGAATVRGTVAGGRVDVAAGRLSGPDLNARFGGHVAWDGDSREVRVEIDADGALAVANRLGYLDEPIGGRFGFVGEVDAAGDAWSYRGTVRSPEVALLGRRFAGVEAELSGDTDELTVDLRHAAYAAGTLAGTLRTKLGAQPYPMSVIARLDGAGLAPLLADLGMDLPGATGEVSAELSYDFTSEAPLAGDGWGSLRVAGVERRPGALPVSGQAPLTIAHGVVSSGDIVLAAPDQRASGSGELDLAAGRGHVAFSLLSTDLGKLTPLLPLADDPDFTPWLPTGGTGTLGGDLAFDAAGVSGRLTADLRHPVTPTLAVDSLSGSLQLSPAEVHDLRLEADLDGGALLATGTVPLATGAGGAPAGPSEIGGGLDLAFDAADWPAASLAFLLPQPPAVEPAGRVSGRVTLEGSFDALSGTVDAHADPLVLSGFTVAHADARLAFDPQRVAIEQVTAEVPAGTVAVNGTWELADGALDLALRAPSLDLAAPPLSDALPGGLGGRVALQAAIAGTLAAPAATLNLTASDLTLDGQPLGEGGSSYLEATWSDARLSAQGSLLGLIEFTGGGRLDPQTADLSFSVSSPELAELVRLATAQSLPAFSGSFSGTLAVQGDPRAPADLVARLELNELEATFQGHEVANLEPVVVRLGGGALTIESLYLGASEGGGSGGAAGGEPASELFVGGTVGLSGAAPTLALNVQSSLSAAWAKLVVPQVDLDGDFDVLATVRGTLAEPQVSGQGEIRDGRLILSGFPHSLDGLTATALFYPNQVVLDSLQADFAGGKVRAAGRIDLSHLDEGKFDYRFQASGEGLSVRYPEGFLLRGDANLSLVSTEDGRQLVGTVDLDRAFYLEDIPVKVTQLLQRFLQRTRVEAGETDEDLASTQLALTIHGPGALRVHNNLADLKGDIDLTVRGTLANPVVFGTVEAAPGGKLVYADNDYKVERALLTFSNPYQIDPVIDLVATTVVKDYDVTLQLSGTLERLDATFTSDPPLADLDVLALITTGQTVGTGALGTSTTTPGETPTAGTGAQTFLYGQAASAITERVNQLFGFDRLRVNPISGSGGGGTSVAFTVGKQISRDLYVTYSRDPTSNLDYVLQAEWAVTSNVTLVLTQNGSQSYAVDVRWESRF